MALFRRAINIDVQSSQLHLDSTDTQSPPHIFTQQDLPKYVAIVKANSGTGTLYHGMGIKVLLEAKTILDLSAEQRKWNALDTCHGQAPRRLPQAGCRNFAVRRTSPLSRYPSPPLPRTFWP